MMNREYWIKDSGEVVRVEHGYLLKQMRSHPNRRYKILQVSKTQFQVFAMWYNDRRTVFDYGPASVNRYKIGLFISGVLE